MLEVISGDAYQVYKQLNIGTAKPSADELKCETSSYRYIENQMIHIQVSIFRKSS